ncbi:MAG TPA: hypothetical protein VG125_29925 [Pirellulales bacterium]|jgi:hypothetical protein|nr:hypothetical protein [Pirellulales bacterium]
MRRCTRHSLVYASIVALVFLELSSVQQGEVPKPKRPTSMGAATDVSVGPLLFRPRVTQPPAADISVPTVNLPGVVTLSHVGHLPLVIGEIVSLQEEHIRLQI